MHPKLSYLIWFVPRSGSTFLCERLSASGIAGHPAELLNIPDNESLLGHYGASSYSELQRELWKKGGTPNGVFGFKASMIRSKYDGFTREFARFPGLATGNPKEPEIWENAFPNLKYIFLTRRNKIRQAVSWWKAIVSQEWHRRQDESRCYDPEELRDRYDYAAIRHLLIESTLREAAIQDFLEQAGAAPLNLVYEDFCQDVEGTICRILDFLGLDDEPIKFSTPTFQKLADELTEEWVDRFRKEIQQGWEKVMW